MPRSGDVVGGRYRIAESIGEGGFAAVYRAVDEHIQRPVAVKVLDPFLSRRHRHRGRFQREIGVISQLTNPHAVALVDQGVTDHGALYLVMELLKGRTLAEELAARLASGHTAPIFGDDELIPLARQVLLCLSEAHSLGFLHRDIKPSNLFLLDGRATDGPFVKVLDFGLAMTRNDDPPLTRTLDVACSPWYVAPERLLRHPVGPASDLYSFALTLAELIHGHHPLAHLATADVMRFHADLDRPVPIPASCLASALAPVLRIALDKDVQRRFRDADAMRQAFDACIPRSLSGNFSTAAGAAEASTAARETLDAYQALRSGVRSGSQESMAEVPTPMPAQPPPTLQGVVLPNTASIEWIVASQSGALPGGSPPAMRRVLSGLMLAGILWLILALATLVILQRMVPEVFP